VTCRALERATADRSRRGARPQHLTRLHRKAIAPGQKTITMMAFFAGGRAKEINHGKICGWFRSSPPEKERGPLPGVLGESRQGLAGAWCARIYRVHRRRCSPGQGH